MYDSIHSSINQEMFDELFAICEDHPFVILVEGAPGIGKTILSKEG